MKAATRPEAEGELFMGHPRGAGGVAGCVPSVALCSVFEWICGPWPNHGIVAEEGEMAIAGADPGGGAAHPVAQSNRAFLKSS